MSAPPDKDQRTLKPTPRRIGEFRARGEIARSRDLTTLLTMTGAALFGLLAAQPGLDSLRRFFVASLGDLHGRIGLLLAQAATAFAGAAVPAAAGALVGWLLSAVQLGWPPLLRFPRPHSPFSVAAIASMVSPKAMFGRVGMSTLKVAAVGAVTALAVLSELRSFTSDPAPEARELGSRLFGAALRLGIYAGSALAVLAIIDYVKNKRQLMARMRMTPAEAKREARDAEGDPLIKRRRRQRMRELAKRRIAAAVKTADVVVVNPTHYAVALRYAADKERAPRVVAKGTDELAERIRAAARRHGVPILARPPLARMLHKLVPEGREIPAALYRAVAEVLAYIYRLRQRRR